jgi:2,3-bisphosphoglycerate-dependent phosphoglycerate mutase
MQIYFIRHAQSENNALWDRTGSSKGRSTDPELTEIGLKQAGHLARFLTGIAVTQPDENRDLKIRAYYRLTHIYCSLMVRSIQTGLIVAREMGLQLAGLKDLHEGGGIYKEDDETGELVGLPGKTRSELAKRFPDLAMPIEATEAGWWNRPFETHEERFPRGQRILTELIRRHGGTNDRVGIISHGGFYQHFMTAVMGLPERLGIWLHFYNVAITRIDYGDREVSVVYMNRTDALPDHLIT